MGVGVELGSRLGWGMEVGGWGWWWWWGGWGGEGWGWGWGAWYTRSPLMGSGVALDINANTLYTGHLRDYHMKTNGTIKWLNSSLKNNTLFSDTQHRFISKRSISLHLFTVSEGWMDALDNGSTAACIYMDCRKALDTVPHSRTDYKVHWNCTGLIISCFLKGSTPVTQESVLLSSTLIIYQKLYPRAYIFSRMAQKYSTVYPKNEDRL